MSWVRGTDECSGRPRYWVIPLALLSVVLVVGAGFFLLARTGVVAAPPTAGSYPFFWPLVPLGFLSFWVVVVLVLRPWRGGRGWGPSGFDPIDARETVRLRYARGEISRAQMVEMIRDLAELP